MQKELEEEEEEEEEKKDWQKGQEVTLPWRLAKKSHHHHHRGEAEGKCTARGAPHLIPNLAFVKNSVTSERASERALLPSGMAVFIMTMMKLRKRRREEFSRASLSLFSWCSRRVCFSGIIIILRLCVLMLLFVCCCCLHTVTGFIFCSPHPRSFVQASR